MDSKENKLEVIVRDSGLEATKAQTLLTQFKDYFDIAAEWELKAKSIVVTDASQVADMQMARVGRLFLREKRIAIEKSRKELKEQALREGKAIDGIANVLKAVIVPIETYLEQQEKFIEIRDKKIAEAKQAEEAKLAEEKRKAEEEAERLKQERIRQENIRLNIEMAEKNRLIAEAEKKAQEEKLKAESQRKALEKKAQEETEKLKQELMIAESEKNRLIQEQARKTPSQSSTVTITCPKCGYQF